ncbi:hypothetical protein BRADI_2g61235v3, partial [Brachypodium distachyon]
SLPLPLLIPQADRPQPSALLPSPQAISPRSLLFSTARSRLLLPKSGQLPDPRAPPRPPPWPRGPAAPTAWPARARLLHLRPSAATLAPAVPQPPRPQGRAQEHRPTSRSRRRPRIEAPPTLAPPHRSPSAGRPHRRRQAPPVASPPHQRRRCPRGAGVHTCGISASQSAPLMSRRDDELRLMKPLCPRNMLKISQPILVRSKTTLNMPKTGLGMIYLVLKISEFKLNGFVL